MKIKKEYIQKLKLAYIASKLAKQYKEKDLILYEIKEEILEELIKEKILIWRGFHQVGEYKRRNYFGLQIKRFYANLYSTKDGKWQFHLPRENGRGKGYLGRVEHLDEQKEIKKINKKEVEELVKTHQKLFEIYQEFKKKEEEKRKKIKKLKEKIEKEGYYEDIIYGKYSNDYARFKVKFDDDNTFTIVEVIKDYSWARNYTLPTLKVGEKINLEELI